MKTETFLNRLSELSLNLYKASFQAACKTETKSKAQKSLDDLVNFIRTNADFLDKTTNTVFNAQNSKSVTMPADATYVKGPWIPPLVIKSR